MNAITAFYGEYRWLSNFWYSPITTDGWTFPTAEHCYQAAKSNDPRDWAYILQCTSPAMAKRCGKNVRMTPDWPDRKLEVMREIVWLKFTQNPELKTKLLATGDVQLIEGNTWGDTFWGVCRGRGENHLGKILMETRTKLKEYGS